MAISKKNRKKIKNIKALYFLKLLMWGKAIFDQNGPKIYFFLYLDIELCIKLNGNYEKITI